MKRSFVKGTSYAVIAALSIQGFSFAAIADENQNVEGTLGFARLEQEDAYVNVRAEASTETGEVIGILRNGDSAVIESVEDDGWYKISSGDVEGYVAARLIATGDEADAIAAESAYTYAKVNAVSLNVRTDSSEEADVIGALSEGDEAEVIEAYDGGAFVRVCVDSDTYGYVSADYVELVTDYPTGMTLDQIAAQEEAADSAASQTWEEGDTTEYTEPAGETYTDNSWTDTTSTDTGYTDTSYTDTSYTDTGYTDTTYTETYTDTSSQQTTDATQTVQTEAETTAQTEAAVSTSSASGSAIASYACQYVGIPYVWGGSSLSSGVDCSGFTMCVFAHFGISLPHYAASQYSCGTPVSLSDLAVGDLVFYNGSSGSIEHVAIYVGGGSIVHARGTGYGVCYSSLNYDTPDAACRVV